MHHLRFRQVHLDFHTSPAIPGIGLAFDKDEMIMPAMMALSFHGKRPPPSEARLRFASRAV